ncbi:hypothetical protein J2Y03_005087 [Neobacillus niacini]|uniref:hypothetical protein n=1 Tax=Neobacillus niacini TaxID=86668 RepID=UPI002861D9A4|nr:hypothetical protein [Neobacillus niacini]
MTLAALELKEGNVRVIEAPIKYGYNPLDLFSRAFKHNKDLYRSALGALFYILVTFII